MKSPFKFLDSYTKEDRDIFFGREREIEELYHRVFESKIMLVYGVSGTGKSSLIHCGLSNKFSETDWLPLMIRRGGNMIESLAAAIKTASITKQANECSTPVQFRKAVKSLYLDHYKPAYFIFDQFEELFIFGSKEEKKEFIQVIKTLIDSDIQCRFIFVMREEYMAGITEFEKYIPTIFSNRVRIEKMAHINAIEAIKGPCEFANISIEEGFAESLLEKLSPDSADVELTFLQVFLDKIYRLAQDGYSDKSGKSTFTIELLRKTGNVSDLLGSFLDEQISLLDDPDTALAVLKSFVSVKGTKRQMNIEEVSEYSKTLGKPISENKLNELLLNYIRLRILRDKDQNDKYELRHDSLATKIYEKITLVEKEILEIRQFIENANNNYHKRGVLLSSNDLDYIAPYESRLYLSKELAGLIEKSKYQLMLNKRRKRNFVVGATILLLIIFVSFTIWALNERTKAEAQRSVAEQQKNEAIKANQMAEEAKQAAINAKTIAENELYKNVKNSLSVSPEKMNVLYIGIGNPLKITVSGIPDEKLKVSCNNGIIKKYSIPGSRSPGGLFMVYPEKLQPVNITVFGEIKEGILDSIGTKNFRVKLLPMPYASFADQTSGVILMETALETKELIIKIDIDFDVKFIVKDFSILTSYGGNDFEESSKSSLLTQKQIDLISRIGHNKNLIVKDITVESPDQKTIDLPPIILKILNPQQILNTKDDRLLHQTALELLYQAEGQNKIQFLYNSIQLFDSIKARTVFDLTDELAAIATLFQLTYDSNLERTAMDIQNKLLSHSWNKSEVEQLLTSSNQFTSSYNRRFITISNLHFTDYLFGLCTKFIEVSDLNFDQRKAVASFCADIAERLLYDKQFRKSLDFCINGLRADSTNKRVIAVIPLAYLLNDNYYNAEEVIIKHKDNVYEYRGNNKYTFRDFYLNNLYFLELDGISHQDFNKVKELLNK